MGINGNGQHLPSTNGSLLSAQSVQDLLVEFEATGRQEPFAEIVRRYAGMVYNVCFGVTRDAHEAEDATQAVFLTLAVRSKTAQKIQYLGPWLQRVAQRMSLDIKRSKKRRAAREVKHHDINVGRWQENNQPADLGLDELRGILRDEIDKLPAKYRMPLILHYFGGLKPEDLSKELGIKANTLGVRLHRARKMLADNLQRRGIVVGGAMLSAALATMVPVYVQQTIVSKASVAAATWAIGHSVVGADVSANVMGLMASANRSILLGKLKAVTAAVAIGVSAIAGAAEFVSKVRPFGLELRNPFNLESLFKPFFKRLYANPVRVSEAAAKAETQATVAANVSTTNFIEVPGPSLDAPRAFTMGDVIEDARASLVSGPSTVYLERTLNFAVPAPAGVAMATGVSAPRVLAPADIGFRVNTPQAAAFAPPRTDMNAAVAPSANDSFAAARGRFDHTAGLISTPSLVLDSRSSNVSDFRINGGSVRTDRMVVADAGSANVTHTAGDVQARELAIAVKPGSTGNYTLAGETATLRADQQRIGVAGNGNFTQTTGTNAADSIVLGESATGSGNYMKNGGDLTVRSFTVAAAGRGTFTQTSGSTKVDSRGTRDGGLTVARNTDSHGTVSLAGGTLGADRIVIGSSGDANYYQQSGEARAQAVVLGNGNEASANFQAVGGTIVFDRFNNGNGAPAVTTFAGRGAPNSPTIGGTDNSDLDLLDTNSAGRVHALVASGANAFIVGNGGDAFVQLGNRTTTVQLRESSPNARTPIIIGATPSSRAEMLGWGTVGLSGPFVQNGRVTADGFGRGGRSLDFSTVSEVRNVIENEMAGDNGWRARNGGRLELPAIHVAGDGAFNWGESADDRQPDLVNAVRFGFSGVKSSGELDVTLLSPDWAANEPGQPGGEIFVGLWKVDAGEISAEITDLLIRYDNEAIENLGLLESDLSLWAYNGGWKSLSRESLLLDTEANLIGGAFDGEFTYFGVAVTSLAGATMSSWPLQPAALEPVANFGTILLSGMSSDAIATGGAVQLDLADAAATSSVPTVFPRPTGVPEPSVIGVIAIAGIALARRRRV